MIPESPDVRCRGIEFDDPSEDELSIVTQSPYFTQATQIVERPTILPKKPSAPSPETAIEVPASSPFRSNPQRLAGHAANTVAPIRTNSSSAQFKNAAVAKTNNKREFIMISDDELEKPLYVGDSSDDEKPARGDIRPSSFRRKESDSIAVAIAKPARKEVHTSL